MEVKPNPQYSTFRTSPHLSHDPTPVDAVVLVQHGTCISDTGIPPLVHTVPRIPTPVDAVVLVEHGGHAVEAEAIKAKLLNPPAQVGQQVPASVGRRMDSVERVCDRLVGG